MSRIILVSSFVVLLAGCGTPSADAIQSANRALQREAGRGWTPAQLG